MEKGKLRERLEGAEGQHPGTRNPLSPSCALQKPCKICQRKGYLITVREGVVAADLCKCVKECSQCFGSLMQPTQGAMRPCHDPNPKRIVSLFADAGIPARYKEASLNTFQNFSGNGRGVLTNIHEWMAKFQPDGGPGLILGGPVGVGKTYLLAAIAKEFCQRGLGVRFIDFHRLLAVIRAGFAANRSEEDVLAPLIASEVLIIDEFGKSQGKDWELEKLDQIVMGRYNRNKVIIASTNYELKAKPEKRQFFNTPLDVNRSSFNPDEFESLEQRVGQRIFSRLVETSVMLTIEGEDFRRKMSPSLSNERTRV